MTPSGAPWPNRAYGWYVVAVLTVAYGFAILDRVAIGLLVQPIEADLKITDSQIGLLQGWIKALPRRDAFDELLLPGERGAREAALRRHGGIPLPAKLWRELSGIGEALGVSVPAQRR